MVVTFPVAGNLSTQDLAATLTSAEQLNFEQLTALTFDTTQARNLATFISQSNQLGKLAIVAKGAASQGTKILSTTVYISSAKMGINVYRLPVGQ